MRKFKKIVMWIMVGIVLESGIFIYFNNYFLVQKIQVTSKRVLQNTSKEEKILKISDNMSDIKISDSGKYIAYVQGGNIETLNLLTKEQKEFKADNEMKIKFFKWMPYKDEIFFLEESQNNDGTELKSYWALDNKMDLDVHIDKKASGLMFSQIISNPIKDIKTSPAYGGFLIETENSDGTNEFYNIDTEFQVNNYLKKTSELGVQYVDYLSSFPNKSAAIISDYAVLDIHGTFLFQKQGDNQIYLYHSSPMGLKIPDYFKKILDVKVDIIMGRSEPLKLDDVSNPTLLGSDGDGNFYIGSLDKNNKVDKLYIYQIFDEDVKVKKYTIKNPINEKNIVLTINGDAYAVNASKIINLKNNKSINYKGKFLQIDGKKLYFIKNGYLTSMSI